MFRTIRRLGISLLGLCLAWGTTQASAQCYGDFRGPVYRVHSSVHTFHQGARFHHGHFGIPAYRPPVSIHFGSPVHPFHRQFHGRPHFGHGGWGVPHGGWGVPHGGRGISIRF
jgi:hypothetical protein